jgi:hypothetical protein
MPCPTPDTLLLCSRPTRIHRHRLSISVPGTFGRSGVAAHQGDVPQYITHGAGLPLVGSPPLLASLLILRRSRSDMPPRNGASSASVLRDHDE